MQKLAAAGAVPRGRHGPAPPQVRDGGYTCLLSAFFFPRPFPACLFSFVRGSDISLPPRILLRRRASCFQPRAFVSCPCPVNVLSVSSQPLLNLLSVSSQPPHIVSLLECIASTHTSSLRTSSHRRRTRRSLHAFIIFPALRVHIPRFHRERNYSKECLLESRDL